MKNNIFNWSEYYKNHYNSKPSHTLIKGLTYFNKNKLTLKKTSIDIGCGQGTDVAELLNQEWNVVAIDKEKEAIKIINDRFPKFINNQLTTKIETMEKIKIPSVSLINASFSLPFCNPKKFLYLWDKITNQLSLKGIFCGQLFGTDDDWGENENMTFHKRSALDSLFNNFRLHYLHEENGISNTSSGLEKNWHVFHLVAIKTIK